MYICVHILRFLIVYFVLQLKVTIMKIFKSLLILICLVISQSGYAEDPPPKVPPTSNWEETEDRDNSSPQLYQSESSVYVYYEKQLDNVTIGITDMQGNTWHYEVTTIPACTYYAVSIESLPSGEYYLCVYQGSKYVIGIFSIN